jgi:hypothetical protein
VSTEQLRQEVTRLRERHAAARPRRRSTSERFEDWQFRERHRRVRELPRSTKAARSRIAWLALVGDLRGFSSAEQLIADILQSPDGSGGRQPPSERSRIMVEREVFASIWRRDPGLGHLEPIHAEWAEILDAAEQWRERLQSVPPATFARWLVENRRAIQDGSEAGQIEALGDRYLGEYAINEGLLQAVVGPDRDALSPEELSWMLNASLQDLFVSEWAWEVGEEVRKIDEREGGT